MEGCIAGMILAIVAWTIMFAGFTIGFKGAWGMTYLWAFIFWLMVEISKSRRRY